MCGYLGVMSERSPNDWTAAPRCDRDDALFVLRRLRDAGFVAYFAGGCVRDLLLGHVPKDWDVATDAPPQRVRALFSNTQAVGAAFGVILVRYGGSQVEVATFRADAEYADGRHPVSVRFTTAEEDARRRDFTVNGLFLDPLRDGPIEQQVIDYVGGRDDLKHGRIRAIGDPAARFREDHLRLLRAVRFAARFGFTIEPVTAAAIAEHAPHLARISPERIADELRAMLTSATRNQAYRLLEQLGLRGILFRFFEMPHRPERLASMPSTSGGARAPSVFEALASGERIEFGLALAAAGIDHYLWHGPDNADARRLFEHAIARKLVRAFRQSLKISNEESDALAESLENLEPLTQPLPPRLAALKRFLARPAAMLSRQLLDALSNAGALDSARADWLRQQFAALEQSQFAPPPLITGDDLNAAGIPPGPVYKLALDAAYDAQLENQISTRDEAIAIAIATAR